MSSAKTFFSYSRNDEAFVLRLAQDLRQAGIPIWFDQLDIPPGQRWDNEIQKALSTSNSLLVVLSPASVASENVMDEVSYALDQNKHVIPVLYQPCDVPLRIRRLQYIDFTANYEAGLTNLLRVLRQTGSESAGNYERTPPPITKTTSKSGLNSGESTAAQPAGSTRKLLLYGAGAVVLALVIFLIFKMTGKEDENEPRIASETTTDNADTDADSVSTVAYKLDHTEGIDTPIKDSILEIMNNYPATGTNLRALPAELSYEITYHEGCFQFYIKVGKGTNLPDDWMEILKNFGTHLDKEMFGDECLVVGALDYNKNAWIDSVQIEQ